ncbi:WAT1-related protein At2g39510-like [Nymphaea colorata]|nr:WAT1-related protein At2g39510-like [Nymphaea colorata]
MGMMKKFKAHLLMVVTQTGFSFLYFITQAAFGKGLNPFVYVTYRLLAAGLSMLPFAYFLERKVQPKLTILLFLEIFVLSLLGGGLTLNLYFASLQYTSPTFVASMINTIASITFVVAVVIGMEKLDVKSKRGTAKVVGTIVSLGGALIMSMYKGLDFKRPWGALISIHGGTVHEDWVKGSILCITSCFTWAMWYVMQASTLKRYPAQISLTTWMSFIGAAQSAVFTAFVERKPETWAIHFDVDFWSIVYSGAIGSGLLVYTQLWCSEQKGPVFVTMFNPLCTILVALIAYAVVGQDLYAGSVLGAVVVIVGLYMVLWGKEKDQVVDAKNGDELLPQLGNKVLAADVKFQNQSHQ